MISLLKLLAEVKRINTSFKITNKTYISPQDWWDEFIESKCAFEFGNGSSTYDKPVIEVIEDFQKGDITFAEDSIKCPSVNPNAGEVDTKTGEIIPYASFTADDDGELWYYDEWEEEEVKKFNEIAKILGNNHYTIINTFIVQYIKDENKILFWAPVQEEVEMRYVSSFDENGNIIFNPEDLDGHAY
jgi:hypothetical protein